MYTCLKKLTQRYHLFWSYMWVDVFLSQSTYLCIRNSNGNFIKHTLCYTLSIKTNNVLKKT